MKNEKLSFVLPVLIIGRFSLKIIFTLTKDKLERAGKPI